MGEGGGQICDLPLRGNGCMRYVSTDGEFQSFALVLGEFCTLTKRPEEASLQDAATLPADDLMAAIMQLLAQSRQPPTTLGGETVGVHVVLNSGHPLFQLPELLVNTQAHEAVRQQTADMGYRSLVHIPQLGTQPQERHQLETMAAHLLQNRRPRKDPAVSEKRLF